MSDDGTYEAVTGEIVKGMQKAREQLARLNATRAYASQKVKRRLRRAAYGSGVGPGGTLRRTPLRELKSQGVGRNTLCPCGSGRKFKHCCISTL
ncbi:MAG: hypothetical protein BWX88_05099 [Planctomycetes bacterium ADurb.Bin126]|nr:MAG: hypothetical protein BWX88_05099 [Planctomycetes bacterium ADurb.Bin126]HOD84732.1 SEC-C metal-binding domain-containing protein [Phycisphaerae bacterium]